MSVAANFREHAATIVVAALSAFFAVTLILGVDVMVSAIDPRLVEESGTFRVVLTMVAFIFIVIALCVGSIVTANTFSTVIAGRTRTIALYRLIGATSAKVRARVAGEGLLMGAIGSAIGLLLAEVLLLAVVTFGPLLGWLPDRVTFGAFSPIALCAGLLVVLTTWVAAWSGSRRVASVSPIEATGAAIELRPEEAKARSKRTVWALVLMIGGFALLALGVIAGLVNPLALLVSFVGGLLSFTGIAIGAHLIMTPLLRLAGHALGSDPTGRLAAANAVRFPERSARATIGLVIGVTLVTMFAVALASYEQMTLAVFEQNAEMQAQLSETLAVTTGVFTGLVGFSAVIAAVGMVNTLSLGVMQRTRELGLLRALGFTGSQIRRMVMAESAQMILAALGFGLLLGTFYG